MALPTIQELRATRPEFDQYGYTDFDIVDWMHNHVNDPNRSIADTARAMGMDLPDSDFANSWQQGWNSLQSKLLAVGRMAVEDPSDPFRASQVGGGLQQQMPGLNIPVEGEASFTQNARAKLRELQQLLQEGIDLERADLSEKTQQLSRYNTNPQSWDEVQVGSADKGIQDYMSHLLGVSGPEMAATAIPGIGAAGLTGRAGLGGLTAFGAGLPIGVGSVAGAQQDQSGYTDVPSALLGGAAYSGLNLLGPEAGLVGRVAGNMGRVVNRPLTAAYQGAVGAAGEIVGEVGQEAVEIAGTQAVDSEAPGVLSPEAFARYKEAAIGAGLLGGTISAATGATVSQADPVQLADTTTFQPPPFPAFSGETTQMVPTGQDFGASPVVGPPRPPRFDPEQAAQAIPFEEITLETVPTEGIEVAELDIEEATLSPVEDTTAARLPPALETTTEITNGDETLSIENVGAAMANLVRSDTATKYTNADLDWANRNLVGKTVDEITAVDTRSPKRQALLQQIVDSAPQQTAVSPDPTVPTTGIEVEEIPSIEATAPRTRAQKIVSETRESLTERQNAVMDILIENPNAGDTEIADALGERTGKKVSRQSIGNTKRAMRRKLEQAAADFGMSVEELQEVIAARGAAVRAAEGAPAQPDMSQVELPAEAMEAETSALGVVQSPAGAQGNIAEADAPETTVTTFGEDFSDPRIKRIPTGYQWLAQNDPQSPQARKEASKFWTAERKGMEDFVPPFRQLTEEQKNRFVGAMRASVREGTNAAMIDSMNQIVSEVQSPQFQQEQADARKAAKAEAAKAKPEQTRDVSRETAVARSIWEQSANESDNDWGALTERQREIFQFEVEDLANRAGLTEQGLARNIAEIMKRVQLDGGAYYEGMYHRVAAERGSQASQVTGWTRKFREGLGEWVDVRIVQSVSELPKRPDGRKDPDDVAGLFSNGSVYLVADNIGNKQQALETLSHEVVGHLGFETMLSPAQFDELLADLNQLIAENDPAVADALVQVRSMYVNSEGKYVLNERDEAREVLAHMAQRNPNFGIIRKLVAMLRVALAKLGLNNLTAARLNNLIVDAGRYVRQPDIGAAQGAVAYSRRPGNPGDVGLDQKPAERRKLGQKYRGLWDATRADHQDAEQFRQWVAQHRQKVSELSKRLAREHGGRDWTIPAGSEADLYNGQKLLSFITRDNKALPTENFTPLATDIAIGPNGELLQAQVIFHMDLKAGGHNGFLGEFWVTGERVDMHLAAEADVLQVQDAGGLVDFDVWLFGISAGKDLAINNAYTVDVDGPSIANEEFRAQWVDQLDDKNFEVYRYEVDDAGRVTDQDTRKPVPPGSVAPTGRHYVRWLGLRDNKRAMVELGKFAARGLYLTTGQVPSFESLRTTGAKRNKQTTQTAQQVERMYHRRHMTGEQHRIENRLAREVKAGWKAFSKTVGPEILNLKGIVDVYGEKLPSLRKYYKSVSAMEAMQTHLAAEAQAVAVRWDALADKEKLDALAVDATMSQIHPDVAFNDDANAHLDKSQRVEHAKLAARYEALSPEAKAVYELARDKMRADWDMRGQLYGQVVGMAYQDAIEGAQSQAEKDKLIEQRDKAIEQHRKKLNELKGPYFPLMRFGKYIAIWKSPQLQEQEAQLEQAEGMVRAELNKEIDAKKKSKDHYIVKAFETQTAMDRFVEESPQEGWYAKLADPADPKMKDITKLGMDKVKDYLTKNVDGKTRASIETMLAELYVGTLPENHSLARELRRQ
ncbi:MAG: hypothetical protein R3212_00785, partial [Xanthomonadales bacterium]|nr:hypothetical protein [Xanthomonadales bacterium]